mmetsp:Transcript_27390/g.53856  ORF Transcript_27390/g.53856 Transcript_27390/m.53856 type:complete len:582 (+) Transcript_27390:39-1784(+)
MAGFVSVVTKGGNPMVLMLMTCMMLAPVLSTTTAPTTAPTAPTVAPTSSPTHDAPTSIFVWVAIGSGATLLMSWLFAYCFIKRYTDPTDSSSLVTVVGTLGISIMLFCVLIIPIDIYAVSYNLDQKTGVHLSTDMVKQAEDFLQICYYGLYCALMFFAFLLFPFAYFYFEEDSDEEAKSSRCCAALKYTTGFFVIFVVLIVLGAVIKIHGLNVAISDLPQDLSKNKAEQILYFTLGVLTMLGMTFWASYGSYGMAALPINMLRSAQIRGNCCCRNSGGMGGYSHALQANQENQRFLTARYDDASVTKWSKPDRLEYGKLKREERELKRQQEGGGSEESSGMLDRCWNFCAPCRMGLSLICFCLSLLVVVSMLLASLDRLLNSPCGIKCAYTLQDGPKLFHPIDKTLTALHKIFPLLDFILFGVIALYIFLASIAGLVSLGVRMCMWQLYSIKTRKSMAHALLMGAWMLMFVALVINFQVLTLAPQYAAFGTQFYVNKTTQKNTPCSFQVNVTEDTCTPTQVARFVTTLNYQLPFFGTVLLFANLVFCGAYLLFGICALIRARKPYEAVTPDRDALLWSDIE